MGVSVDPTIFKKKKKNDDYGLDDFVAPENRKSKDDEDVDTGSSSEDAKRIEEQKKEQERRKEEERKEAERQAQIKAGQGHRNIFEKIGDAFEANSPQDKAKRKAAGLPEDYKAAEVQKKDQENRAISLNFSKDEIAERKDYYERAGVKLSRYSESTDQFKANQEKYQKIHEALEDGGGGFKLPWQKKKSKIADVDLEALANEAEKEGLFEGNEDALADLQAAREMKGRPVARNFYAQAIAKATQEFSKGKLDEIEEDFQRYKEVETQQGQNVAYKALRNINAGIAETFVPLPSNVQSVSSNLLDIVAPDGTFVDDYAKKEFEKSIKENARVKAWMTDQGMGKVESEGFIADLERGVGSLLSSIATGTAGAPVIFGVNQAGEQTRGSREAGNTSMEAGVVGTGAGVVEGLLERWGLGKMFGRVGQGPLKAAFGNAISEGTQEFAQSMSATAFSETYKDVNWGEAIKQGLYEGAIGAILGGGTGILTGGAEPIEGRSDFQKGVSDNLIEQGVSEEDAEKIASELDATVKGKMGEKIAEAEAEGGVEAEPAPEGTSVTDVIPPESGPSTVPNTNIPVDEPVPPVVDEPVADQPAPQRIVPPKYTSTEGIIDRHQAEQGVGGPKVEVKQGNLKSLEDAPPSEAEKATAAQLQPYFQRAFQLTNEAPEGSNLDEQYEYAIEQLKKETGLTDSDLRFILDEMEYMGPGAPDDLEYFTEHIAPRLREDRTYPVNEPAEFIEDDNKIGIYREGDYVVDRHGRLKIVTAGNDDYEEGDYNRGFLRTSPLDKLGENGGAGWVDYANQVRTATPEEIAAEEKWLSEHAERHYTRKGAVKPLKGTQKERVAEVVEEGPKSIKEVADETGIKEPNVRRILGVGAKDGTFERVDKGVYVLKINGKDLAYVETADAVEALPRLASEGFKADMVFLDIPYETPAVKGGNRGANYEFISPVQFGVVMDAVGTIARSENTPIVYMYSNAKSGLSAMQKYNDVFVDQGYVPVGRGEYQKTYKDGKPVAFPTIHGSMVTPAEGIIVFSKSGQLDKELGDLNFKLVRPKGYQTEKPAEMLKSLIEMTTEEGDVVLDPFAGSGVTGAEAVKSGRKSYNIEKDEGVVETITKPRIEGAVRKGAVKKLGKTDVSIQYPEAKDLPETLKENMPGNETMVLKTVSGREVVVDRDIASGGRKLNALLKKEAITEAKLKKDAESERKFKLINLNIITKEQGDELKTYAFGDLSKKEANWEKTLKPTDKLTPKETQEVAGAEQLLKKSDLALILQLVPGLKENPVVTIVEREQDANQYGNLKYPKLAIEYKSSDGKQTGHIFLNKIGISDERAEAAGLKEGMTIDLSEVLNTKAKGKVPTLKNNSTGVSYHIGRDARTLDTLGQGEVARSPEELKLKIEQLNKAGQKLAIKRRGQLRSKKAIGVHQQVTRAEWLQGKLGTVKLRDEAILNPETYMTVLAHELSHAIEFAINGTSGKTFDLFDATKEEKAKMREELKAIVNNIEGKEVAESKPEYFYKPTEMLARYVETMLLFPGKLNELAPLTTEKWQQAIVQHPQMGELMNALDDSIDKGFKQRRPNWWHDLRQIYQHSLGKEAGDVAYNAELVRRAEMQNWRKQVRDLMKKNFKGVKDDQALLFRTAEAIKGQDKNGNIQFGTKDYKTVQTKKEAKELIMQGYQPDHIKQTLNGPVPVLSRERYSAEQGKEMFESLSPEGQALIKRFTANKAQALKEENFFNRELIKDVFKIDGAIEGWVHRGIRNKPKGSFMGGKNTSLRQRTASMKKSRSAESGHMEDFAKQMEKALREAGDVEINNRFFEQQLARTTKPIAKGQEPDEGWVEVEYNLKKGLTLPGEAGRDRVTIQKTDELTGEEIDFSFLKPTERYQMPKQLAKHYRNVRNINEEMTRMQRFLSNFSKYWAINVLIHGGTVGTNFIGGGLQYTGKVMNDFYLESLSGNFTMPQTRRNVAAMVQVLVPGYWKNASDYIYGGQRSTYAGQFMSGEQQDSKIDKFGNVALLPFATVESYWKKAIMISEQAHKMEKSELKTEMTKLTEEEKAMIGEVNKVIDLWAYDYDNTPVWLDTMSGHTAGRLAKPFLKYPYKYSKMISNLATGVFDKTLTPQERAAKLLTLTTMTALALLLMSWRDDERETPEASADTPAGLDPRGRLFLWKNGPEELFVRTAKYPFINLTSLGRNMIEGDFEEARNLLNEQFGTVGVGADVALILMGRPSKFEQYTPMSAQLGKRVATIIPGFRILNDIGRAMDEKPRKAEDFKQGFFGSLPAFGDEEARLEWRGKPRTVDVPDEPEGGRSISRAAKTSTEKDLKINDMDILLSALTGIYITRINVEDAKAQSLREQRNDAEAEIRALLEDGKNAEAKRKADEAGFTIPDSTYDYYKAKRKDNK